MDLVATSHGLVFALVRGLAVGLLHGLAAAVLSGLVYWYASERETFKPSPVRIEFLGAFFRGARPRRRNIGSRFLVGLGCGLAVALTPVLVDEGVIAPLGLADGQGGGPTARLVFLAEPGLGGGSVFALTAFLETPVPTESVVSPTDLLAVDRRNVAFRLLARALAMGPAAGVINAIAYGPVRGLEVGIVFGLEAAFGAGLGYALCLTTWGQWVALSRIWLPLTGRLPWAPIAFLDDAHQRGVLRQVGAVYQFRHARIQHYLSMNFQEHHESRPSGSTQPSDRHRQCCTGSVVAGRPAGCGMPLSWRVQGSAASRVRAGIAGRRSLAPELRSRMERYVARRGIHHGRRPGYHRLQPVDSVRGVPAVHVRRRAD